MSEKLAPGAAARFVRDGVGFQTGHRGRVVGWMAVQGDGSVVHTVINLDTGLSVLAVFPGDLEVPAGAFEAPGLLAAGTETIPGPDAASDYPELSRGNSGDPVRRLQGLLNRVGAMLVCDSDFGGATERGVRYAQGLAGHPATGTAGGQLWSWLEGQPEPFPPLTTEGVALIAREETGGLGYYEQVTRWPHFPGAGSGITIGIGYDLRFKSSQDLHSHWAAHLAPADLDELDKDIGQRGTKTRVRELRQLGVVVPFEAAWAVFIATILPHFHTQTANVYPSLPRLPDLCRSVLVSLVYNRGTSVSGARRREMKAIQDLLQQADDPALHKAKRKMILLDVEDEILSMKRLWDPSSGLHRRRQTEANSWRAGVSAW